MTFTIPSLPKRQKVGQISVELYDRDGSNARRSIQAFIEVTDNGGTTAGSWTGDILPFLPQQHVGNLAAVLDWLREEAESRLLEG